MTTILADDSGHKSGVTRSLERSEPRAMGSWEVCAKPPALAVGEIHVWKIALEDAANLLERLSALLTPEERERAQRFRFAKDRERFVTGRGALRCLAAAYLGREAGGIEIETEPHGKPKLKRCAGEIPLECNVSHSGEMVAMAFAVGRRVGIDVEKIRGDLDWAEIAVRFFRTEELRELRTVPEREQPAEFFRVWTRKEAFAKALGLGLGFALSHGMGVSLSDFRAELRPAAEAHTARRDLNAGRLCDGHGREYWVAQFEPAKSYAGAVVAEESCAPSVGPGICRLLAWTCGGG